VPQLPDDILNSIAALGVVAAGVPAERLTDGSINTVWRVRLARGGAAVLRVGPSAADADAGPAWLRAGALACEAIVLDRVRPVAPRVPVPVAAGFRGPDRCWLLQEVVPGRPLAAALPALGEADRAQLWRELGTIARRVHGVRGGWFGTPDGHQRYPDWPSMVRADAVGLLDDARRFGIETESSEQLLAEVDANADALDAVTVPAVVHSDLDPRHVFVEEGEDGWRISGVIDWEYARYADPMSESLLVGLLAREPRDAERVAFLTGYELDPAALDEAFWIRQDIYRGIAKGWVLTDAARLHQRALCR
jgi:aminoglycoside phosphotransferase (APT) family kinase protein